MSDTPRTDALMLGHETRYDENGILDEFIVNNPKHVHLERMGGNEWWIGIDALDGATHHIRFSTKSIPEIETEEPSPPPPSQAKPPE